VRALEEAMAADKKIFLATQHDASVDEPRPNEIYTVGTIVNIVQSLKLPDGNIKVLVEGVERAVWSRSPTMKASSAPPSALLRTKWKPGRSSIRWWAASPASSSSTSSSART